MRPRITATLQCLQPRPQACKRYRVTEGGLKLNASFPAELVGWRHIWLRTEEEWEQGCSVRMPAIFKAYVCLLKFFPFFFSDSACGKPGDSKQHKCSNQFRPKKLPDFTSTTQPNTQTTLEGMGASVSQAHDTLYYLVLILQHYNNSKRAIAGHVNPKKPTFRKNGDCLPPTYALALPSGC